MADGEVTYELRADDSKINGDIAEANRKIKKSAEESGSDVVKEEKATSEKLKQEKDEVADHHKKKNDEIVKDDRETGEERTKNEETVSWKLKGLLSDAASNNPLVSTVQDVTSGLSGGQAAALGFGAAFATVSTAAVGSANDMSQAMNGYLAATGKSKDETARYQSVLEGIYKSNFGESFTDIANAMATVNQQMGELSDESLQSVVEDAMMLRDVYGYDISESVRSVDTLMKNFGISSDEAFNLIAQGAQHGLDFSGEMIDSINEYSTQFAKMGLSANDMFNIMAKGAETGAWNLDKIGDAVKEMSIRVVDGSDTTKEGFEAIGLDADEMAEKFAAGGESAKEAFEQTIEALAEMEDPLAQNAAGVALFGTMWEDLGPEVVTHLADIGTAISGTTDAMGAMNEVKYNDLTSMMQELQRNVEMLILPIGELLLPLLQMLAQDVLPLLTTLLGPIIELTTALLAPIVTLIGDAIQPLIDIVSELMDIALVPLMAVIDLLGATFEGVMSGINEDVVSVIENCKGVFQGLLDFLFGVFTGDWELAWSGVQSIFDNIFQAIGTIWKVPFNWIIDGINGFISGLNEIKIPDWVPVVGGKGFNIAKVPRLKKGTAFIPEDFYPAYLDYGERVLTQEDNQRFMRLGGLEGMEVLASAAVSANGSGVIGGKGKSQVFDYDKLADAVAKALEGVGVNLDGKPVGKVIAKYVDKELGKNVESVRKDG